MYLLMSASSALHIVAGLAILSAEWPRAKLASVASQIDLCSPLVGPLPCSCLERQAGTFAWRGVRRGKGPE